MNQPTQTTPPAGLIARLQRSWARDRQLGLGVRLRKVLRVIRELMTARYSLRACNRVGASPRVFGHMRVENLGAITIGDALGVRSPFVPTELLTGPDGSIEIGSHVWINFGTVIAAQQHVKIGDYSQIGQYCILSDVEIPETALDPSTGNARPIHIGTKVWLAGRVTVRPGVTIGDGSVVISGSIVESDIPSGVVAGGIPARVIRRLSEPDPGVATVVLAAAPPALPAPVAQFSGMLVSDFTIDDLAPELMRADALPSADAIVAPYAQVTQTLLEAEASGAGDHADFVVVWTRPATAIPAFARIAAFEQVTDEALLAEVDAYTALIGRAAGRYKTVFVPTWLSEPWKRGLGVADGRKGGVSRALSLMNLRLMDNLGQLDNVFVLNADRWLRTVGPTAMSPKAWYLGKMAIARAALTEAALDIRAALASFKGGPRKLLILDLDDTMWGGIVGDAGWENLRLGGLDGLGESFVDFQRAVKDLKRRGVVLAIASKNEESVALEAIRKHPDMVLREDDFVAWRINWSDKARNIAEIATELNLGLQSVVFIDDNPVERTRVRDALPEVLVPEWPADKFLYRSALESLRCFDAGARTQEDLERTRMYAEERKRDQLRSEVGSLADWLKGLEIKVRVEPLNAANLARATQLLNKTNQLNLATRRLTESELMEWTRGAGRSFWTVSVSDRLGDAGLTGLVSTDVRDGTARIVDYVLSCRVMGRKVEEAMVHIAVSTAIEHGATSVVAEFLPTAKNKPCLSFWKGSGFSNESDRQFSWDAATAYAAPDAIQLEWHR